MEIYGYGLACPPLDEQGILQSADIAYDLSPQRFFNGLQEESTPSRPPSTPPQPMRKRKILSTVYGFDDDKEEEVNKSTSRSQFLQDIRIGLVDDAYLEKKIQETKRKMHTLYKEAGKEKHRKRVQMIGFLDLPKGPKTKSRYSQQNKRRRLAACH